ncbi:hypothetical protein CR513_41460, partial [Mucuna pruriens]
MPWLTKVNRCYSTMAIVVEDRFIEFTPCTRSSSNNLHVFDPQIDRSKISFIRKLRRPRLKEDPRELSSGIKSTLGLFFFKFLEGKRFFDSSILSMVHGKTIKQTKRNYTKSYNYYRGESSPLRLCKLSNTFHALHAFPGSYLMVNPKGKISFIQDVSIDLTLGKYKDEILYDVIPMEVTYILLERPFQFDRKVTCDGVTNKLSFAHKGNKVILKPLTSREVIKDQLKMKKRRKRKIKSEKSKVIKNKKNKN